MIRLSFRLLRVFLSAALYLEIFGLLIVTIAGRTIALPPVSIFIIISMCSDFSYVFVRDDGPPKISPTRHFSAVAAQLPRRLFFSYTVMIFFFGTASKDVSIPYRLWTPPALFPIGNFSVSREEPYFTSLVTAGIEIQSGSIHSLHVTSGSSLKSKDNWDSVWDRRISFIQASKANHPTPPSPPPD